MGLVILVMRGFWGWGLTYWQGYRECAPLYAVLPHCPSVWPHAKITTTTTAHNQTTRYKTHTHAQHTIVATVALSQSASQ